MPRWGRIWYRTPFIDRYAYEWMWWHAGWSVLVPASEPPPPDSGDREPRTPRQAHPPGPTQTAIFDAAPGAVDIDASPATKVAFYAALFGAHTDVYALRWDNARTGRSGWMPAVRGG